MTKAMMATSVEGQEKRRRGRKNKATRMQTVRWPKTDNDGDTTERGVRTVNT